MGLFALRSAAGGRGTGALLQGGGSMGSLSAAHEDVVGLRRLRRCWGWVEGVQGGGGRLVVRCLDKGWSCRVRGVHVRPVLG